MANLISVGSRMNFVENQFFYTSHLPVICRFFPQNTDSTKAKVIKVATLIFSCFLLVPLATLTFDIFLQIKGKIMNGVECAVLGVGIAAKCFYDQNYSASTTNVQAIENLEDDDQLFTVEKGFQIIEREHTQSLTQFDEGQFKRADRALNQLESQYELLRREGRDEEADQMLPNLQDKRILVQALNGQMNRMTERDLKNLNVLFTSPIEKYYFDPETNERYIEADTSKIMHLVREYFQFKEYEGFGITRYQFRNHPITGRRHSCAILACKKSKMQFEYENRTLWIFKKYLFKDRIKEIQQMQKARLPAVISDLDQNYRKWGFESYCIYDSNNYWMKYRLKDNPDEYDRIVFFREKAPIVSESKIEEVNDGDML